MHTTRGFRFRSPNAFPVSFSLRALWGTGLVLLLMAFGSVATASDTSMTLMTELPAQPDATFEDALGRVVSAVLNDRTAKVEVSALRTIARRDSVGLRTWGERAIEMPWEEAWVFMIDDAPLANWAHPCRYVFVSADLSQVAVRQALTPLSARSITRQSSETEDVALETVIPFDFERAVEPKKKRTDAPSRAIRYDGPVSNCYAVIISGGADKNSNHIRYWGDAAFIYSTLTLKYGYSKTNIYTLISDGLDPAADRSDDTNSPWDLDGDGTNDTLAAATAVNVSNVFVQLQSILTTNDQLFVFLTDHGSPTEGGGEWDVELNLWNDEILRDKDLKALTENLPCPVIFSMEQCYSGGFLDDLNQSNRTIATAAQYDESSWAGTTFPFFNQWAYYWTAAMRGFYPQTNAPWLDGDPCDGDLNGDGVVSFAEASEYAYANKFSMDHPMYQENPTNMGRRTFLSMVPREQLGMGGFALNATPPPIYTGRPVSLNIAAENVWDDVMTNYSGTLKMFAEAQPIDPGTYIGNDDSSSEYPLNTTYMDCRIQTIYPAATFGDARTLYSIAIDVIEAPSIPMSNLTIRLKQTAMTCYPTNPVWETEGWTTVYTSNLVLSTTGWYAFEFSPAFAYDGANSLMVDFSFHNEVYDDGGSFSVSLATNTVSIAFVSDNEDGDPLTWSNRVPVPHVSEKFPRLRFGPPPIPVQVEVTPTNLTGFADGVCTGEVSFLNTGAVVRLWVVDATNELWKGVTDWFEVRDGSCSTLADATHAPQFSWTTGGDAEWFAQSEVVRETGPCAAQAGDVVDDESSWIQTEVTGAGLATFYWKVSSEEDYDYLSFYVNDEFQDEISGEVDWEQRQYELIGVSTLRWDYAKDGSEAEGDDTGWMTDFVFQPFTGRVVRVSGNLAFGKTPVNTVTQRVFAVSSLGDEAVTVTGVAVPDGFTADPTNFVLAAQSTTNVTVTFTPTAAMVYTGNMVAVSDAQSGISTLPVSGTGLLVANRFVWADNPTPAAPYTNWAMAARTLQDALDLAGEGDTVWVTNGVYDAGGAVAYGCTNRAVVTTGVVLRSVNGPDVTHIVGAADPTATNEFGMGPAAVRGVALLGDAAVDGFTIRNGSSPLAASSYGGGVGGESPPSTTVGGPGVVRNCVVTDNAARFGGGVAHVQVEDSLIQSNRASHYGGGLAYASANRCRIAGNWSVVGGGGYYVSLSNCMIVGNTAQDEGGGVKEGDSIVLDSCTVVDNRAGTCGGIANADARNSIIYYNTALTYPNYAPASTWQRSRLVSSCSTPLAEGSDGTGNIAEEPRIVSLADPHLLADSPCINAGTNMAWMADAVDFDGDPRIDGGRVDIGADEFWANSLTDTLHVAIGLPAGDVVALHYPLPLRAEIVGRCEQTLWELDGGVIANTPLIYHSFTNVGLYEVRLSASNLLGTVSAVVTVSVQDVNYYVTPNGSDAADGMSWATAKQTIQAAVDACTAPGGVVWVSNGVYATGGMAVNGHTNRVAVTNAIAVRSVNGPEVTFIHGATDPASTNAYGCGANAVRGVHLSGGASLSGFTVAGGRSGVSGGMGSGGGIYCVSAEESISNCVVVGNASLLYGGGVYRGTIAHSVLSYNEAASNGGGAFSSDVLYSTILGNRALYGGGISSGTARNCLIADNSAILSGGGAANSALQSCTVIGNDAFEAGGADSGSCVNTILYYNEAVRGPNWMQSGIVYPPSFSHSCTTPMPTGGEGNIASAPILSGMRGGRLLPGSPCIGAGIAQDWMNDAPDCDGEPRLNNGSTDIGWDQLWADACTNELEVAITFPNGDRVAPNVALPMVADDEQGRLLGFVWNFGDGDNATNEAITSHAWATAGEKVVTLTATNLAYTAMATATVTVENVVQHVAPSGNDGADGTSWAVPKQTIQAAVDASIYGGLILVSNGVYDTGGRVFGGNSNSNRVILTNAVTLRGVNGPEVTIIAGRLGITKTNDTASVRCVMMGPNTRIEGFSLTNGHGRQAYQRDYGGGAWCMDHTAVISNCVFSGCSAWEEGGGVYRGEVFNSRIERCVAFYGGGAGDARLYDCVITNNTTYNYHGSGLYGGVAVRCEIVNNIIGNDGLGAAAWGATLSNCVVRGNVTGPSGQALRSSTAYNTLIVEHEGYAAGNVQLYNCTVTGNGRGIYGGSARNSIVFGNLTTQWLGSASFEYTCTTPLPGGVGCFTNDPLLDAQGRLTAESPCVNAGTNQAWMAGAADLDGDPRIQNAVVDMGAYESPYWGRHTDVDGDGFTDWIEVNVTGTDPTDVASFLGMTGFGFQVSEGEGIVVRWQSVAGKLYNVDRATNLMEAPAFLPWFSGVVGWPDTTSVTDTTATAEGPYFYRVGIEP